MALSFFQMDITEKLPGHLSPQTAALLSILPACACSSRRSEQNKYLSFRFHFQRRLCSRYCISFAHHSLDVKLLAVSPCGPVLPGPAALRDGLCPLPITSSCGQGRCGCSTAPCPRCPTEGTRLVTSTGAVLSVWEADLAHKHLVEEGTSLHLSQLLWTQCKCSGIHFSPTFSIVLVQCKAC